MYTNRFTAIQTMANLMAKYKWSIDIAMAREMAILWAKKNRQTGRISSCKLNLRNARYATCKAITVQNVQCKLLFHCRPHQFSTWTENRFILLCHSHSQQNYLLCCVRLALILNEYFVCASMIVYVCVCVEHLHCSNVANCELWVFGGVLVLMQSTKWNFLNGHPLQRNIDVRFNVVSVCIYYIYYQLNEASIIANILRFA